MNCEKISNQPELVLEYVAGSGDAEFERHLNECGECSRVVAAQRAVWESLDQLAAPAVSQDFDARLYARIAEEEAAPAWRRWLPMAAWKPAMSMAALCAMVGVGLVTIHSWSPVTSSTVTQPAAVAVQIDMEQVANALDDLDLLMPAGPSHRAM